MRLRRRARAAALPALLALSGCVVTPEGERAIRRAADDAGSFLFLVIMGSLALLLLLVAVAAAAK